MGRQANVRIPCAISDERPSGMTDVTIQLLEREEERTLIAQWQDSRDQKVAHRLIRAHYPLVVGIARKYSKNDDERFKDLFSVGVLGLFEALLRFKLSKNVRFGTYARWWVQHLYTKFASENYSGGVCIPTGIAREVSRRTRHSKGKLSIRGALSYDEAVVIANDKALGMKTLKPEEILQIDALLSSPYASLDAPVTSYDDGHGLTLQEVIPDESLTNLDDMIERNRLLQMLRKGIEEADLTERERFIFEERRLKTARPTLEALGKQLGVSRQRVEQLEALAFRKVQQCVKKHVQLVEDRATRATKEANPS